MRTRLMIHLLTAAVFAVIGGFFAQRSTSAKEKDTRRAFYMAVPPGTTPDVIVPPGVAKGNSALGACVAGFHMASLWEIHDVTALRYDTRLGFVAGDSGFGPPEGYSAWVRTGAPINAIQEGGVANCNGWTSDAVTNYGMAVYLNQRWYNEPFSIAPWAPTLSSCANTFPVWCVED